MEHSRHRLVLARDPNHSSQSCARSLTGLYVPMSGASPCLRAGLPGPWFVAPRVSKGTNQVIMLLLLILLIIMRRNQFVLRVNCATGEHPVISFPSSLGPAIR